MNPEPAKYTLGEILSAECTVKEYTISPHGENERDGCWAPAVEDGLCAHHLAERRAYLEAHRAESALEAQILKSCAVEV